MFPKILSYPILSLVIDFSIVVIFIVYFKENLNFRVILVVSVYIMLKITFLTYYKAVYLKKRGAVFKKMLESFKKGSFSAIPDLNKNNSSDLFYNELAEVGLYLDDLVSSQREEIKKFRELYNNVVLAVSSYFIVFDDNNVIIFANESFCKKFNYNIDEVVGQKLDNIFYFISNKAFQRIEEVKDSGKSHVISQVRVLSKTKVAVIVDLKISMIQNQGQKQICILMEDITSKCRKDYQISILSQISESINKDNELERILYAILTAVTSGAGLGFNRAMLFLYDNETQRLKGELAVGPDSLEEAVQIWSESRENDDIIQQIGQFKKNKKTVNNLSRTIQNLNFNKSKDNILFDVLKNGKSVHMRNWLSDDHDEDLLKVLDVDEFAIVPLLSANKPIGILIVDNKFNQAPIWDENIELLAIFAAQAALSIENAHQLSNVRIQMKKIQEKQNAIVESEKLAAVGRIAAHIAHEIRNPLVTMGGYARRILHLVSNPNKANKKNDTIDKCAEIILEESERLEKILSNVMDFTRPAPLFREYNSINQVIKDTISLLKNALQEKKIVVNLKLDEKLPMVKSDFNQLKQVMLNLIQNAMDVTKPNGSLEIESYKEKNKIFINVKDSGPGVKEEDIDHLFDPFFTTKVTGVGLGLAIVKKIVNDHNGKIKFNNIKNGGEFKIVFTVPSK